MWFAAVGLRRRTTSAVRAAMDGSPNEAEARPRPEIDFKFQKNYHFRMDTNSRLFNNSVFECLEGVTYLDPRLRGDDGR